LVNKLAIREAALVVLLAAATFALTWKAKGLEKRLLGQSDEAVMTNRPAPDSMRKLSLARMSLPAISKEKRKLW